MTHNGHLVRALTKLIRPLARLLLRNGMSYKAFAEVAKRAFVEVAREDFRIPGRKQSDSRISVITGLSRKEVKRVQANPELYSENELRLHNRAARVIHGWVTDRDYLDEQGNPARLNMDEGGESSFTGLVKRYSGDAPPRAVLDELDRVHAVERHDDGRLSLKVREYAPPSDTAPEKLDYIGEVGAALISSVDRHWQNGHTGHYQGVARLKLSEQELEAFRRRARTEGSRMLDSVSDWKPGGNGNDNAQTHEAGVVLFSFEK